MNRTAHLQQRPVCRQPAGNVRPRSRAGACLAAIALSTVVHAAVPVSAEFLPKASDPRGGNAGYNTFNRLPDGRGVTYAGFSHDHMGNNAVAVYDPVADAWQVVVPNTPWINIPYPPGASSGPPWDGRGLDFLGNRDDHVTLVVDNDWWVLDGQRGGTIIGNWRGVLDTQTWQWTIDDDPIGFGPTGTALGGWVNSAAGWHPALDVGYIFAGTRSGNPTDGLIRIERNAPGTIPAFRYVEYRNAGSDTPSFAGAERLEYISNQQWVRGVYVHVYGGQQEVRSPLSPYEPIARVPSYQLWQVEITDPPELTVVSTNTLPAGQRIEGMALHAYRDPARDLAVVTNGKLVNVYDYATGLWHNVPVLTASDPNRESPSSQGAGHAGFFSPAVDQYIILGVDTKTYGLKLNFTGTTIPSAPINVVATGGNASAVVTFSPPLTDGGSPITSYSVTSNPPGGVDIQAGTTATTRTITNLVNGTPYTFTVVAINAIGPSAPSAQSNAVTPSPGATVPSAPLNVVAAAGNAAATVTFSPPLTDGGSPITSYVVTSNPAGGVDQQAGTAATVRTITGLVNGIPYTFTVTATNALGTGPPSAPSNSVTPAPPITVPGAPTGVFATAGDGTATVSFTAPASNGGSAIIGYTVTSNPPGGVDVHGGTPATTHLVSNLVNGISYAFTVTARNAIGTGAPSAPSNAVTPQFGIACAGFVDVPAGDAICASVEWLKNRAITLGCAASQFCPAVPLARLAMAAFSERLGVVLTPAYLFVEAAPGALDVAAQPVVCASGSVAAAAHPRAARVQFAFSGAAGGVGVFAALPVVSLDGGSTWVSPVQNAFRSGASGGQHASLSGEVVIELAPGTEYSFATQLFAVSGSSAFTGGACQLVVEIVNQNGAYTPYDPASGAARGRDGDLH